MLFTRSERANGFVSDLPGYGGGMVADCSRILEKPGIGDGVVPNPGLPVGADFKTSDVARLAGLASPNWRL